MKHRRRLGLPPGLPVESGPFPATLEWRPVQATTDNRELFNGWISDIQAVLALAGISLVTRQTSGGRIFFEAAGRRVAEIIPKMGAWEGRVYYQPQGGPGPGARGRVAAEELRRSSQWLGYGASPIQMHLTPEQEAARAARAAEAGQTLTYTIPPERLAEMQAAAQKRLEDWAAANPEVQKKLAEGRTRRNIGIGVAVLGGLAGIGLAFAGGKLALAAKIAIGAASGAAAVGGGAVAATAKTKLEDILESMTPPAASEYGGRPSGDDKIKMMQIAAYSSPLNPFYEVDMRPNPGVVAEMFLKCRSHKDVPDTTRNLMPEPWYGPSNREMGATVMEGIGAGVQEVEGSAGISGHTTHYRRIGSTRGYTLDTTPMDSMGRPLWVEVMKVESISHQPHSGLICHPYWYVQKMRNVAGTCWHNGSAGGDAVQSLQNATILKDGSNNVICTLRHWRYLGENNHGWMTGYQPNDLRGCCGGSFDPLPTGAKQFLWCEWGPGYEDYLGSGYPPRGFFMPADNTYLQTLMNSNGLSGNVPSGMLAAEQPDPGWPADIKGPMAAISQVFRALKAANPAVTMMYWDDPEPLFHIVADYAQMTGSAGGWYAVGDIIGTVLGIASFVCEVASPIITAVNPAAGAALGTAIRMAGSVGSTAQQLLDEVTNADGSVSMRKVILDAVSLVGSQVMDAPAVQALLKEGWSKVTNLADSVGEACDGWLSLNGTFSGEVSDEFGNLLGSWRDVLDPYAQYANLLEKTYSNASQNIMSSINDNMNIHFYVEKMKSYTDTKPSAVGASVFEYGMDLAEKYRQ